MNDKKTRVDVEALKVNWINDPNWDIENTNGFEAYFEELHAFRLLKEKQWKEEAKKRHDEMPINKAKYWVTSDDNTAIAYALIACAEELIKLNRSIEEFVDRH